MRALSLVSITALLLLSLSVAASRAQPASPNCVLDLDGSDDYVQLPPAGFTNFHEATIGAWVKWRGFNTSARVFDFGFRGREVNVGTASGASVPNGAPGKFLIVDPSGTRRREEVHGAFRPNEWTHVALVTGPGGVQFCLNGLLVATNDYTASLSSLGGESYLLGVHTYTSDKSAALNGQLDDDLSTVQVRF